jgi:DNA-binding CsgD family transcriptional regulator
MSLPQQRLTTWLQFTRELLTHPAPALPRHLIADQLAATFGTQVSWNWLSPDGDCGFDLQSPIPGWPPPEVAAEFDTALHHHPLMRWFHATGSITPTSVGRVPKQLVTARGRYIIHEVLAPAGIEQQVSIAYRFGADHHRAFLLARHRDDFTAEDLETAGHLQTLLMMLDHHYQALATTAHPSPGPLTWRELAVLALLAEGLTAAAIAHRLQISPHTVHHHLDSCYRKLGVHDRLQAVLTARDASLLPASGPAAAEHGDHPADTTGEATFRTRLSLPTAIRSAPPHEAHRQGGRARPTVRTT